ASPSSVQPLRPLIRCCASLAESFMVLRATEAARSLFRFSRAHLVEPEARRLDSLQRFLLQLERGWSFDGADERAAGDRPMIRALGLLQRLERRRVLALPLEPAGQPRRGFLAGRGDALDAEVVAGVFADRAGDPAAVARLADDAALHSAPNRAGPIRSSAGSIRSSSSA